MLFELDSRKTLEEIDRGLREAAARHKFGVITVHDLKQTMKNKGVDYAGECMIYEVCNPQNAKQALEANPAISTALPCRISVYRAGGVFKLSTMLPSQIMRLFDTPALEPVAGEVEAALKGIMTEAA
ncbi:MAG: DUF302 domain-containing protein [Bryobacteraceae bacterium]